VINAEAAAASTARKAGESEGDASPGSPSRAATATATVAGDASPGGINSINSGHYSGISGEEAIFFENQRYFFIIIIITIITIIIIFIIIIIIVIIICTKCDGESCSTYLLTPTSHLCTDGSTLTLTTALCSLIQLSASEGMGVAELPPPHRQGQVEVHYRLIPSSLLSYTPLMHSSHTLLSYTPLIHSSHALLSRPPLIHRLSIRYSSHSNRAGTAWAHVLDTEQYDMVIDLSLPGCDAEGEEEGIVRRRG
jgi:hypothetical protein